MAEVTIREPERIAHATVRGFYFQILHSALAWLDLGEREALLVEGNEDLDRLIEAGSRDALAAEVVEQNLKDLAGPVSAGTGKVRQAVLAFMRGFVHHHIRGVNCRLIFRTTAALGSARKKALEPWLLGQAVGDQELLGWLEDLVRSDGVINIPKPGRGRRVDPAITSLSDAERVGRGKDQVALDYLREHGLVGEFRECVQWEFGSSTVLELRSELANALRDSRHLSGLPLDPATIAQSMISELLRRSSHAEQDVRTLRRVDLELLINDALVARSLNAMPARSTGPVTAYVAVTSLAEPTAALAALVFDDEEVLARSWTNLQRKTSNRPGSFGPTDPFSTVEGLEYLAGADFDAFAIYESTPSARKQRERFRRMLSRIVTHISSSRTVTRLVVPEVWLGRAARFSRDGKIQIERDVGGACSDLARLLADSVKDWLLESDPAASRVLEQVQRKVRFVYLASSGEYRTQESPLVQAQPQQTEVPTGA